MKMINICINTLYSTVVYDYTVLDQHIIDYFLCFQGVKQCEGGWGGLVDLPWCVCALQ